MLLTQSRLSHCAAEHLLPSRVEPMPRQRADDLAPNGLLTGIKFGGRLGAALTGNYRPTVRLEADLRGI